MAHYLLESIIVFIMAMSRTIFKGPSIKPLDASKMEFKELIRKEA
jgi:hypothetical protein